MGIELQLFFWRAGPVRSNSPVNVLHSCWIVFVEICCCQFVRAVPPIEPPVAQPCPKSTLHHILHVPPPVSTPLLRTSYRLVCKFEAWILWCVVQISFSLVASVQATEPSPPRSRTPSASTSGWWCTRPRSWWPVSRGRWSQLSGSSRGRRGTQLARIVIVGLFSSCLSLIQYSPSHMLPLTRTPSLVPRPIFR